ncbi:exopolysaccharide biosynthesis polyprenyl glycosylphosphotransferase [Vibrio tritonius]|uniref:exopolysaccharide biosynthesis polyprenyl glycosylphosphotransferase n=1 Tax=Vibrio tritonius TaxID=1435069 RepID=UPI00315D7B3E
MKLDAHSLESKESEVVRSRQLFRDMILNPYTFHFIGIMLLHAILSMISGFESEPKLTVINSGWLATAGYLVAIAIIPKVTNFLLVDRKYYILPIVTSVYGLGLVLIVLIRLDYSRAILLSSFFYTLIWLYAGAVIRMPNTKLTLSVIDNFDMSSLTKCKRVVLKKISSPYKVSDVKDGLIVDLHGKLSAEQEKFIADCSINGLTVFHSYRIQEMIEGKVETTNLSENAIGSLLPNPIYQNIKRCWECLFILLTLPVVIPIMLITAIMIKLESKGPVIFSQWRIGQGGKAFKIYKLRSMSLTREDDECKYATQEVARITRIGRFIRKTRIDELPQFFNVLKGDMALIGPRPEQDSFVEQLQKEIPFYGYRHTVKPGITGWAQTVQGYADDMDSNRNKLAYDLYYIKHFSIWLDMNIILKTLKIVFTGFGAK